MPNGGLRMVLSALKAYGYEPDPHVVETFSKYRKTHNEGVFDAYTADVMRCRSSHILTGLPDAYGRGRIIGDYRRVALYGVSRLIKEKQEEKRSLDSAMSTESIIRDREELSEQIRALNELKQMASSYGFDISKPAFDAREAVQWLYFAYLAAVKEQNGAACHLAARPRSLTSTSNGTSQLASSPSNRRRRSSMTSSLNCESFDFYARQNTTSSSQVIQPG
jgi:formate C-acetyltransferase